MGQETGNKCGAKSQEERFSSVPVPDHKPALHNCFRAWLNKDCPTQIDCCSFLALPLQCPGLSALEWVMMCGDRWCLRYRWWHLIANICGAMSLWMTIFSQSNSFFHFCFFFFGLTVVYSPLMFIFFPRDSNYKNLPMTIFKPAGIQRGVSLPSHVLRLNRPLFYCFPVVYLCFPKSQ